MICHFLNLFERKAEIQNSIEKTQLFQLMDQLYLRNFGISLQEKSAGGKPKFEKTYLGPLYRNQLFTIISNEEKDQLLNFQSVDPLYFAKCELSINYLTLGYEINEISWLVDYHYKSNHVLFDGLTFFLDLLKNYKYLKNCIESRHFNSSKNGVYQAPRQNCTSIWRYNDPGFYVRTS